MGQHTMTSRPAQKTPFLLIVPLIVYAGTLAALTLLNRLGPERWWFTAFNLYLPQAIWLIPGVVFIIICFLTARRWLWLPLLCVAWVAGPLMGLCWPWGQAHGSSTATPVRVMTWNVKYCSRGKLAQQALRDDIARANPDIVMLQDAGGILKGALGSYFAKWHLHSQEQFVIASRFPLAETEILSIGRPSGKQKTFARYRVKIGSTPVSLYNIHLESPREGLSAVGSARKRPWYLPKGIQRFERNVSIRLIQARMVQDFISQEKGPVIIGGDLNSPDASQVCAGLRDAGLHDAFAEGGRGYGYTYGHFLLQRRIPWMRVSWMRIDHVMMSSHFKTLSCRTGTGEASDHRPVIADLLFQGK